jgi:hypothetical protein
MVKSTPASRIGVLTAQRCSTNWLITVMEMPSES